MGLAGLDGEKYLVLGKILLPFSFEDLPPVTTTFHVTENLNIPGDVLLGLEDMAKFSLNLLPFAELY